MKVDYTCCACGEDFQEDEVEEVVVGMEGKLDFMCKRCHFLNFEEDEEENWHDDHDDDYALTEEAR